MAATGRSNSGRHTCFMCILFMMSAAAIVMSALVLNRMLNDDDDESPMSTLSPDTAAGQKVDSSTPQVPSPVPEFRTEAVVDCDPPNQRDPSRVDQEQCGQRQ